MKVLKKLGVMGLVLGLTMGAVGCSNGSEDKKDDSAKKDESCSIRRRDPGYGRESDYGYRSF